MSEDDYIAKTLSLMSALSIRVRDTFQPPHNLDDFYSNGGKYHGPRHFRIEWLETGGFPSAMAAKRYNLPNFTSIAYDSYRIVMPKRYLNSGRDDPIIHECVHFLQHTTSEEESAYIKYDGSNYQQYVGQRVELEAHLVQVHYMLTECGAYVQTVASESIRNELQGFMNSYASEPSPNLAEMIILRSKQVGLI